MFERPKPTAGCSANERRRNLTKKELDIDKKLPYNLKITGILNNLFRPQKLVRKQE